MYSLPSKMCEYIVNWRHKLSQPASLAEWSKAVDLSSTIVRCVSSSMSMLKQIISMNLIDNRPHSSHNNTLFLALYD